MNGVRESDIFVVEWIDPRGKRCRRKIAMHGRQAKRLADELADQIAAQLTLGSYETAAKTTWKIFQEEYEQMVLTSKRPETQRMVKESMTLFAELCSPTFVADIRTKTVDDFKCKLLQRRGKKRRSKMSPANANKHLRHLKACLRKAHAWDYLPRLPQIVFLQESEKSPRFMTPGDFDAIYKACDQAAVPSKRPYGAVEWWRALMVTGIMAGLRIAEMLTLSWDDLHLDDGYLVVRHEHAKGRRDDVVPLHACAVSHLRRITDFGAGVFDWPLRRELLWDEWTRIQQMAGIHLPCHDDHDHTPRCHVYGFHDLKRACGTLNAGRLPKPVLNAFMRNRAFSTTDRYYLNHEKLVEGITDLMFVPSVVREAVDGH
jgi:integrase